MEQKKILIADDSELNRAMLVDILGPDYSVIEVSDGKETIAALQAYQDQIAVLLLDVVMPHADGFEVLSYMQQNNLVESIPVIMISAETSTAYIEKAFSLGASDYINRPFVPSAVRHRVANLVLLKEKTDQLLETVDQRFSQRAKNTGLLLAILSHAVESHGSEDGTHMNHVDLATRLLLERLVEKTNRYHLRKPDIDAICMAAELHDIGKLKIPAEIITKPGKLTREEFEIVKQHTVLGSKLISEVPVYQDEQLIKYALEIAHWHHERWDGEGYPDGLKGDEIPISAQAVALADVYDALTGKRCYKEAYSHETAIKMILAGECGSFNPLLLECLVELDGLLAQELSKDSVTAWHQVETHRTVKDLGPNHDTTEARLSVQLEMEHTKRNFFSEISQEIWFEYSAQPPALQFSAGAIAQTGLPSMLVNPMENTELARVISRDALQHYCDLVYSLDPDKNYLEAEVELLLDGQPRWCQISAMVTWILGEERRIRSIVGCVRDIDQRYRNFQSLGTLPEAPAVPTPQSSELLALSQGQLIQVLQDHQRLFDLVRLVDPVTCRELRLEEDSSALTRTKHCYAIWNKDSQCENCISRRTIRTKQRQAKMEFRDNEVYYVISVYTEVDGIPYALELANRIQNDQLISNDDNMLNQLLVRNRQVYTDSVTKVYNRRYFDEQVKKLEGEFAFAMIDLDRFKQTNDTYGHLAGDMAIYRAAQAIRSRIRAGDKLIRYGGDEFFLLLVDLPRDVLRDKLENIRDALRSIVIPEYPQLRITGSIGGAYAKGRLSETVALADLAMYEAKKRTDCVIIYNEEYKHESEPIL